LLVGSDIRRQAPLRRRSPNSGRGFFLRNQPRPSPSDLASLLVNFVEWSQPLPWPIGRKPTLKKPNGSASRFIRGLAADAQSLCFDAPARFGCQAASPPCLQVRTRFCGAAEAIFSALRSSICELANFGADVRVQVCRAPQGRPGFCARGGAGRRPRSRLRSSSAAHNPIPSKPDRRAPAERNDLGQKRPGSAVAGVETMRRLLS
jgi:hypothetical protein